MNPGNIHISNAALAFNEKVIFSELNCDIPPHQWTGLLGPSGIGKSSLLRLIAGLTTPAENSQITLHINNNRVTSHSHQIAYMAQTDLLLPWLTTLENVTLKLKLRGKQQPSSEIEKAKILLEKVGLLEAIALYPHQLSGGMRQRAALARTLLEEKPIILMDEPFSALDAITRHTLQNLAADLLKEKTVFFITHDPIEALRLAHRIYIMQGHPAKLKLITHLTSPAPRELSDPEVTRLQSVLFNELIEASKKS